MLLSPGLRLHSPPSHCRLPGTLSNVFTGEVQSFGKLYKATKQLFNHSESLNTSQSDLSATEALIRPRGEGSGKACQLGRIPL